MLLYQVASLTRHVRNDSFTNNRPQRMPIHSFKLISQVLGKQTSQEAPRGGGGAKENPTPAVRFFFLSEKRVALPGPPGLSALRPRHSIRGSLLNERRARRQPACASLPDSSCSTAPARRTTFPRKGDEAAEGSPAHSLTHSEPCDAAAAFSNGMQPTLQRMQRSLDSMRTMSIRALHLNGRSIRNKVADLQAEYFPSNYSLLATATWNISHPVLESYPS
ncbi:uncharacterized protein [Narcine bancroftii]|uniref:uncharacterized protein n=1 Tax=Narcine bancroftii TaxID=1343680 RepID=UPI0038311FA1